jgi:hypothetical protein
MQALCGFRARFSKGAAGGAFSHFAPETLHEFGDTLKGRRWLQIIRRAFEYFRGFRIPT